MIRGMDRRWLALIILSLGTLMIVIDATIVNVALLRSARTSASPSRLWPGS